MAEQKWKTNKEGRGKKLGFRFHQVSDLFIKEDLKSTNLRYRDEWPSLLGTWEPMAVTPSQVSNEDLVDFGDTNFPLSSFP
jgi:hypothetical protein